MTILLVCMCIIGAAGTANRATNLIIAGIHSKNSAAAWMGVLGLLLAFTAMFIAYLGIRELSHGSR